MELTGSNPARIAILIDKISSVIKKAALGKPERPINLEMTALNS